MLTELQEKFIDCYLQTYSPEEAAKKAGIPHTEALKAGIDLLNNEEIQNRLKERSREFQTAYNALPLTKERLIGVMFTQYEKANRLGRTKEAVEILSKIAEASGINFKELQVEPINFIINNLDESNI